MNLIPNFAQIKGTDLNYIDSTNISQIIETENHK